MSRSQVSVHTPSGTLGSTEQQQRVGMKVSVRVTNTQNITVGGVR